MKIKLIDKKDWHSWFAWYPVWVGTTFVWLSIVNRRWIHNASSVGDFSGLSFDVAGWEYKL